MINTIHFGTISSTNDYAKENAAELELPVLITADAQTAGRGRQGRSFYSPKDTGLYFSLLFEACEGFSLVTPAAAVSVCETIEEMTQKKPEIKWVNDIFLNGRKISGILAERFSACGKEYTVIGIGINFTTGDFPGDLINAGSLGVMPDRELFAQKTADRILSMNNGNSRDLILEKYRSRLFVIGREVGFSINGISYSGTACGINGECNLLVKTEDGIMTLSSGEISVTMR